MGLLLCGRKLRGVLRAMSMKSFSWSLAIFGLLVSPVLGCVKSTRLLLILDSPYKGKWELLENPRVKFAPGSLIRIRPIGRTAYVPAGFISSKSTVGGGSGTVEEWTLEGIEDPGGRRIA